MRSRLALGLAVALLGFGCGDTDDGRNRLTKVGGDVRGGVDPSVLGGQGASGSSGGSGSAIPAMGDQPAPPADPSGFGVEASEELKELADAFGTEVIKVSEPSDLPAGIREALEQILAGHEKSVDVVVLIDTTGSMSNDIEAMKSKSKKIVDELGALVDDLYVGLGLYRDKGDEYVVKLPVDLTDDVGAWQAGLDAATAGGGGDAPEAALYALYNVMNDAKWRLTSDKRAIIVATDAGYHSPDEMGTTFAEVKALAATKKVTVVPILVALSGF